MIVLIQHGGDMVCWFQDPCFAQIMGVLDVRILHYLIGGLQEPLIFDHFYIQG